MTAVDALEPRCHLAVALTRHVLRITGTAGDDVITVGLARPGVLRVSDNGVVSTYRLANVRRIAIDGGPGNDRLAISQKRGTVVVPATMLGGPGDDSLLGGGGVDALVGGAGADTFFASDAPAERVDQSAEDSVVENGVSWAAVNDFTYQLQNVDLDATGANQADLAILDPYDDNGVARTRAHITALQHGSGGPKRVLAYLSIGEAEDYRPYWKPEWDVNHDGTPDAAAPAWLAKVNADWQGNYAIKYWDPEWQAITFKAVDAIVAQGFDGVYLDLVDAFETWGPDGNNQRPTAERDMVAFVKAIADRARAKDGRRDFAVVPQNGEALGQYDDYLKAITAIGHEDVFYNGDTARPAVDVAALVKALTVFKQAGRPVWVIDYPKRGANVDRVYRAAAANGFVAYCPRRDLSTLAVNKGHEAD